MHGGDLGCLAEAREHAGSAANLQEMVTQLFACAARQWIGGPGSAASFSCSGRSRPAGRRAREMLQRGREEKACVEAVF